MATINKITTTNGTTYDIETDWSNVTSKPTIPTQTSQLTNNSGFNKEAYLEWGGKNFSGSYGCIDASMIPSLGANRLEFLRSAGIQVEYSRDGGATWTDYGLSDYQKTALFSNVGSGARIGKWDDTNKATYNTDKYKLRITLTTNLGNVYTVLNKFAIYISTNGSANCTCTITARTKANLDAGNQTWVTFADKIPILGWSGWNIINTSGLITYGNTTSQYANVRFLFEANGNRSETEATYGGLTIYKILGYGGVGWTVPSTMAGTGHLYSYDANQNATFPANVVGSNIKSKGSSSQPVYFDAKGVATATNGSNIINGLGTGASDPTDADYYVSQYVGGGTTTTSYHRRPHSALWNYIKGKINGVLGLTATSYSGKANTAGTADTANSVAWANVSGKPTIPTKLSDLTNDLIGLKSNTNNRSVATKPNDYNGFLIVKGLKENNKIGITGHGTYSGVLGMRGWTDSSGGDAHEFALTGDGALLHRNGATTTWNDWKTIAHTDDIPSAVTESTVSGWGFTKNTGTYSKPSTGIPKTDLASDVQTSLGKADTALQSHQSLAGYATETWVTNKGYTTNTGTITGIKMNGASKGTSGVVDLGTVITAHQDISGKQDKITSSNKLDYSLISGTPTIPTVNNATLTIQKNGTNVTTFTANASSNATANITVPTKVSELTNDSGFTSNAGTVTSVAVKMNNTVKGTVTSNGTIDLGTVITAHQSLDAYTPTANLADVALNGEYGSLLNLPVVLTVVSELPNDCGYLDSTSFITTGGQTIVDSGALVSYSTSWNVQSVGGATNAYTFYLEVIETSVNTDAKTSAVTYKVYAKGNNNYSYNNFSAPTVTIKVDGTSLGAVNVTSISTTKKLVATKSNTVTHNADGTKTISVQVTYANAETSYLPKPHSSSAYSVTLSSFTETEGVDIAGIRTPNGKVYNLADTYAREQIENIANVGYTMLTGTAGCIGRKWDNGFLEYWIVKAISAGTYTAWQSHYYRNVNANITYPTPFVTELGTLAQYNNPTAYASQPYGTSKTATQTVRLMAFTNQSSLTGTLYMYVWGYWK